MDRKTVIIGSGNVATHLALALHGKGDSIVQVYSRSRDNAKALADRVGADAVADTSDIVADADVYIISVKDDAISGIAESLSGRIKATSIVIHTAGSVPLAILSEHITRAAVLYPMQTFTKSRELDFSQIPCFIEATDVETFHIVEGIARSISDKVFAADSDKRKALHLSAVFACNMVNHCYHLAEHILDEAGLDFSLLYPLIAETADKAQAMSPYLAQTGPMVRYDQTVMDRQKAMLHDEDMTEIYEAMARSIHKRHS